MSGWVVAWRDARCGSSPEKEGQLTDRIFPLPVPCDDTAVAEEQKGDPMSASAEPIYWPEPLETPEPEDETHTKQRITYSRHRVGQYVVTRLVLDARDTTELPMK